MSIQVNEALVSWLQSLKIHVDSQDQGNGASFLGSSYVGDHLTIIKVEVEGASRVLVRNPDSLFSFGIHDDSSLTVSSGDREIIPRPHKFAFIALPGELVNLVPRGNLVNGHIFHISSDFLIAEAAKHGTSSPSLLSLHETIPGHEELILACANQLLKFSGLGNELSSQRTMQPLEQSIVSLLATLVGVDYRSLEPKSSDGCRPSYVQIALTYMEDNISRAINLSDICIACNVSSRTLQVSFQSVMRRTPLQVLQEIRFKKFRGFLLQGLDVGQACEYVGLQQTGRVSAKYKLMFGELPRETRARATNNN